MFFYCEKSMFLHWNEVNNCCSSIIWFIVSLIYIFLKRIVAFFFFSFFLKCCVEGAVVGSIFENTLLFTKASPVLHHVFYFLYNPHALLPFFLIRFSCFCEASKTSQNERKLTLCFTESPHFSSLSQFLQYYRNPFISS